VRQLTFIEPGRLEWRDVAAPRIGADTDALVRPIAVARCDLDFYIARGVVRYPGPFAFGHEASTILSMAPGGRRPFSCSNCWIALILRAGVDGGSVCESDDTGNFPQALGRMFIRCRTSSIGISIQAQ